MPQQLDQNCLDNFKEPGQGVVRVRAGEERGCIVCESGFAQHRKAWSSSSAILPGQTYRRVSWVRTGALDELGLMRLQHQPLLLAIFDMVTVLADEGHLDPWYTQIHL